MTRRIPLIPTLLVALAIAAMIALGIWQIRRSHEKEAMLARYVAAEHLPAVVWPTAPTADKDLPLFRQASANCLKIIGKLVVIAGHNRAGETGYSHRADCRTGAEGPGMHVDLGWSRDPNAKVAFTGGPMVGQIAPDKQHRMRLISAVGLGGLEASAPAFPADIPNNHRSYAVQWFAFALTALVIYVLALRERWRGAAK